MSKLPLEQAVVVSYLPLYDDDHMLEMRPEEISGFLQSRNASPTGICYKMCWKQGQINGHDAVFPVFIMDHAKDIGIHLLKWAGDGFHEWFKLFYLIEQPYYAVVLYPNIANVLERYKQQLFEQTRRSLAHNATITNILRPIHYMNRNADKFTAVLEKISNVVMVGFADNDDDEQQLLLLPQTSIVDASAYPPAQDFLKAALDRCRIADRTDK